MTPDFHGFRIDDKMRFSEGEITMRFSLIALLSAPLTLAGAIFTGINPSVDAANPNAFPLQIFFSASTGSFTQTAFVPEPSTFALIIVAGAALALRRRAFSR